MHRWHHSPAPLFAKRSQKQLAAGLEAQVNYEDV
jgi:hypothetical protein